MADSVDGRGRGATPYPPRTAASRKRPLRESQSSQELSSSSQEEQAGYLRQLLAAGYEGSQESLDGKPAPPPSLAGPATLSQASTGSRFGASPASGATTGGLPVSAPRLPFGQTTTASPPPASSPGAPLWSADSAVPAEEGPPPPTAPALPTPASDDEHSPLVARRLAFGADGSSLDGGEAGGSELAPVAVGGGSAPPAAALREHELAADASTASGSTA